MARTGNPAPATVTKRTLWIVALSCLTAGFFAGVVLTVYKSGQPLPMPPPSGAQTDAAPTDLGDMIDMMEKETAARPDNVMAWIGLGNAYFDTRQHAKAVNAYRRALELAPDNADVWTDLGVMYRRNGQPERAVEAFDRALQAAPGHRTARFNKGIVLLYDLKDRTGAAETWQVLLDADPQAMAPGGRPLAEMIRELKKE